MTLLDILLYPSISNLVIVREASSCRKWEQIERPIARQYEELRDIRIASNKRHVSNNLPPQPGLVWKKKQKEPEPM